MFELGTNYLANSGYVIPFEDRLAADPVVELDDVVDVLRNYYTLDGKMQCFPYNPSSNIRVLEDKRSLIYDIDGNCFEIPEISKMDKASFKKIEIYL